MPFSRNQTELRTDTREIIASWDDIVAFFGSLGITVSNPKQVFSIINRNPLPAGNEDVYVGQVEPDHQLVIQFIDIIGPTNLP